MKTFTILIILLSGIGIGVLGTLSFFLYKEYINRMNQLRKTYNTLRNRLMNAKLDNQ